MADQIRVLLVDDQDLIRTGFKLLLLGETDIAVVGEAKDGQSALDELARLGGGCDVVLMDVRMPRMNGIEATERIVAAHPNTKVLVLTTFDLDEYAQSAIWAGASGFLLKDARPTELVDAIQRVAAGDAIMAPSMMKRMLEQMRLNGGLGVAEGAGAEGIGADGAVTAGGAAAGDVGQGRRGAVGGGGSVGAGDAVRAVAVEKLSVLTEREREVLALIAEGLNNAEISARLFLAESTVKTHIGRVLFKLDLRDRIHAVILAKELGL